MNVHSKKFKFTVFVKRDNKLYTTQSTIDQFNKSNLKRIKITECPKPKTTREDFTNQYKSKGNRTGLNLTPEKMSLIKDLRKLGITYKYSNEDFTYDK